MCGLAYEVRINTYVALCRENPYKTVLMKFLWYIDMVSFEKYGHTVTGLV